MTNSPSNIFLDESSLSIGRVKLFIREDSSQHCHRDYDIFENNLILHNRNDT